jgi:predicted NUDIX family NTP pyrophosphohydrolase
MSNRSTRSAGGFPSGMGTSAIAGVMKPDAQPGGKLVHVWAMERDWNPTDLRSNAFELEWPPRSGPLQTFPEIDRAAWFGVAEARIRILKGQLTFIDRLLEVVGKPTAR